MRTGKDPLDKIRQMPHMRLFGIWTVYQTQGTHLWWCQLRQYGHKWWGPGICKEQLPMNVILNCTHVKGKVICDRCYAAHIWHNVIEQEDIVRKWQVSHYLRWDVHAECVRTHATMTPTAVRKDASAVQTAPTRRSADYEPCKVQQMWNGPGHCHWGNDMQIMQDRISLNRKGGWYLMVSGTCTVCKTHSNRLIASQCKACYAEKQRWSGAWWWTR